MAFSMVSTPQPHYIPGYTGYCPQYQFRSGECYGSLTHKLLLDPSVHHSCELVLSDRNATDFHIDMPTGIGRPEGADRIYQHPMLPGYTGDIPRTKEQNGKTFAGQALTGIKEFEELQADNLRNANELSTSVALQNVKWEPDVNEKQLVKSQFKLPLLEVRPEAAGIIRTIPVSEPKPIEEMSPYFMEQLDERKKLIQGFEGHIPYGFSKFGDSRSPYTNSALFEFTQNYRIRESTEWAPISMSQADPPTITQPSVIYHKEMGLVPNYSGHVPGTLFRSGKTFGSDSRDAKRWLRGDFAA